MLKNGIASQPCKRQTFKGNKKSFEYLLHILCTCVSIDVPLQVVYLTVACYKTWNVNYPSYSTSTEKITQPCP